MKFKFQFSCKIPLPSHHDREISEDAQKKAIRQASHQSSLLLNITNDGTKKTSHKCLNLHFTERKGTPCQKPTNHCHSVPNRACLAGLWHSPLALLVPTLGSQANTSTYLQNWNQWAVIRNIMYGELPLHGISPTQLSSPF